MIRPGGTEPATRTHRHVETGPIACQPDSGKTDYRAPEPLAPGSPSSSRDDEIGVWIALDVVHVDVVQRQRVAIAQVDDRAVADLRGTRSNVGR